MRDVLVIHALHAQVMKDGVNCEIEKFVNDEQTGLDTVCRVVQVHMQVVGGKMQNWFAQSNRYEKNKWNRDTIGLTY